MSAINSVFDPLGIISPVMITGKILYSIACLKKLPWDDAAPEEIEKPWSKWVRLIRSCDSVFIPRSVAYGKDSDIIIHGFSDAKHCRKRKKTNCLQLTSQETDEAEKLWIRKAQQSNDLEKNIDLEKGDDGILRYVGRIPNYKPIFFERDHPLVKLLIHQNRLKNLGASG